MGGIRVSAPGWGVGGDKHKSTTTTHKTPHTGRCKKNAEFTFSTSSPEVQQGPYYDDNTALNKLMANLALELPAMFFFLFFFPLTRPAALAKQVCDESPTSKPPSFPCARSTHLQLI